MKDGYTKAGSGKSMARHLYRIIAFCFCLVMLVLAWKGQEFNMAEATALGTLAGGLAWAWTESKRQWGKNAAQATEQGTKDEAGGHE